MKDCVFFRIAEGEDSSRVIWKDEKHIAFLSIYPNTRGFTVVIPRKHYSSYAFDLPEDVLIDLVKAAQKVGKLLDSKLEDVGRTGMIFEGFGVDHVHAKLFPMHGTREMEEWQEIKSNVDKYFEKYEGYMSTHDYKRTDDKELAELAKKIRE